MPAATQRMFFAIRPDAATAERIESLAQSLRAAHALRGKSLGPARFHVTLHLVGDFANGIPAQVLQSARRAAAPVAARAAPFHIAFDSAASFTRKRRNMPLVLLGQEGVQGAMALQRDLLAQLAVAGLAATPQAPYTPHLTLLYDDFALPPQPIEAVAWLADELLLVRSLLGLGRHEVLARLPLAGGSDDGVPLRAGGP